MTTYVVIAYDISDNSRRFEASEKLRGLGFVRIQRSLYIARGGYTLAKEAFRTLLRVIDRSRDSVFVVVLSKESFEKAFIHGAAVDLGEESSKIL
ncbi:CRISPR-associated endonuclease Cas2 [Ignisphaera sp. 4213-co]|uniref:CRISPR-associated endoribonuclease Cas2 n=1 Tax=Ignisphaera cupida TaxID=3050454 RepID=A0ABD4ZA15_9CREN|nr:CRISPR-associated endonuclease Cas2 [Ignisphaera sp. 4213-co]MDK6029403.1 CRISPR-associated endonuclease Cas2 [Ignisphaera sp. 4213-co]